MKKQAFEYWAPVVVWLAAIFLFSTDALSSSNTSQFVVPFLRFCFPTASTHQLDLMHHVIRKLGHITEYSILTLLVYRTIRREADPAQAKFRTIVFVVLAACSDEFHQSFSASRTPSPFDVGYDTFAAVCVLWLIYTYETWRLRPHSFL